jgi:hypothetical protein
MELWQQGVAAMEKYQSYNKVLNRGIVGNKRKYIRDATTTSIKYRKYKQYRAKEGALPP